MALTDRPYVVENESFGIVIGSGVVVLLVSNSGKDSSHLSRWLVAIGCVAMLTACGGGGSSGGMRTSTPSTSVSSQTSTAPIGPVGEIVPVDQKRIIPITESRSYRPTARYASVLTECAFAEQESLCELATLPYIGLNTLSPSVEDVMQRLVVTHDWMGVRFEEMLHRMPADMLGMFSTVTAVVIGSDVRPSSFWPTTGVIRLDPRYLWLNVDEKRTISSDADPRSEYGAELQFVALWREMIGDNYAVDYYSLNDDQERTLGDLEIGLAGVMYHELAHANDIVERTKLSDLSLDSTPLQAYEQLFDTSVSMQLYAQEALTAQQSYLYELGGVRYYDDDPSDFHRSVLADFVGAEMGTEGKATFYSYSSIFEDSATLLEAAMLKFHYDVETHTAFSNKPANYPEASCDEYKVAWGVRNRLASVLVAPRAEFVVNRMIASSGVMSSFFATGLGRAKPLRVGDGWCTSRYTDRQSTVQARVIKSDQEDPAWKVFTDYK